MPAGFQVFNDQDVVMIDNNFSNLAVVSQGVWPANPLPSLTLGSIFATAKPSIDAPTYAWFLYGAPSSDAHSGLQVFDDDEQLTFCASLKSARVVGAFNLGAIGGAAKVHTYGSGRIYAAFVSLMTFAEVQLQGVGISQEYRIVRRQPYATVSGATVTAGWTDDLFQDWQPVPPGGVASFPAPAYDPWVVVLDVTNF